jgi:trehalose 6-phosphate phosphatase
MVLQPRPIDALPSALLEHGAIRATLRGRRLALFADFDGTLSPIVEEPSAAALAEGNRERLERLGQRATVAVISGRDLDDLEPRVGAAGLYYAGSHGFQVAGPDGWRHQHDEGLRFLDALDRAEAALRSRLERVPGVLVERKRFAIAVHDRRVADEHLVTVRRAVAETTGEMPSLRLMEGKRVHELRPALDWDKGRAMLWLLEKLALPLAETALLFIGDDTTDEDAFRAMREAGHGIAIVVGEGGRESFAHYALRDPAEVSAMLDWLWDEGE